MCTFLFFSLLYFFHKKKQLSFHIIYYYYYEVPDVLHVDSDIIFLFLYLDLTGNRSRSFDATYSSTMPRKCAGSSWFSRRHLPISVKLPLPVKSPSIPNSPGPSQLKFKTPILTVTNENSKFVDYRKPYQFLELYKRSKLLLLLKLSLSHQVVQ